MPSVYQTSTSPMGGPMRNRITLKLASRTTGSGGQDDLNWSDPQESWNLWAGFQEIQPKEALEAGREKTKAKGLFWTRFSSEILRYADNAMRVIFGGQTWEVERVENPGGERKVLMFHTQLLSEG